MYDTGELEDEFIFLYYRLLVDFPDIEALLFFVKTKYKIMSYRRLSGVRISTPKVVLKLVGDNVVVRGNEYHIAVAKRNYKRFF